MGKISKTKRNNFIKEYFYAISYIQNFDQHIILIVLNNDYTSIIYLLLIIIFVLFNKYFILLHLMKI